MAGKLWSFSREGNNGVRRLLAASIFFFLSVFLFLSLLPSLKFLASLSLSAGASVIRSSSSPLPSGFPVPSLAYLISGTDGDEERLIRLLFAVYHPRNVYLLHLDLAAPEEQRRALADSVRAVRVFRSARNVHVMGKADFADPRGSSALSAVLHGAAVLLRLGVSWDWFVNLDASEYPLMTQDDILHIFSFLPRDLNFVRHSGHIGWRESRRLKPIIVDPGLYHSSKRDVMYATQKRELPNAYRLFSGSGSVILSRRFLDYCILGIENLPRTLLMYYANIPSSHSNYFQTLLCNSAKFSGSVVNSDLRYTSQNWSMGVLTVADIGELTQSGAAFAGRFEMNSPALDWIDRKLLNRQQGEILSGGWCLGKVTEGSCSVWGSPEVLNPGRGAQRLENLVVDHLSDDSFLSNQCK
ncbi:core-2/I-branching beta-1,6-N-acetylglucosaminyltransferase family protein [Wolffia australiana]